MNKNNYVKTSVLIEPGLMKKARIAMAEDGLKISEATNIGLTLWMQSRTQPKPAKRGTTIRKGERV